MISLTLLVQHFWAKLARRQSCSLACRRLGVRRVPQTVCETLVGLPSNFIPRKEISIGCSSVRYVNLVNGSSRCLCAIQPVFFIRDPAKFPSLVHAQKRDPQTNLTNPTMVRSLIHDDFMFINQKIVLGVWSSPQCSEIELSWMLTQTLAISIIMQKDITLLWCSSVTEVHLCPTGTLTSSASTHTNLPHQ